MITIIADPHAYRSEPQDALRASGTADYVRIRGAIRDALDHGQQLTVHVTDRLLVRWFEDLAGYEGVRWERVAPEADFRRLFGVDPAPPFSPELLIELDIVSMNAPPPGHAVDPAGWALGERVHPLWAASQGSAAHLGQLISWAMAHADALSSSLYPLVQQRLVRWAGDHPAYAALRAGSLAADATNLVRRTALQRYDIGWLREQGLAQLPVLTGTLDGVRFVAALRGLAPAIERYWREHSAETAPTPEFVHAALERMSGWSAVELHAIEQVLRRDASLLDPTVLQRLRRRFADLPEAGATLDELEVLVPPARPALPQEGWNDAEWLRWATREYMPYFTWTVRAQQPRDHQHACALAYEAWLARRYPHWLAGVESPLITGQFTLLRDLLSAQLSTVVVWLVVDGMTWWQGRMLREICRHQGLHAQRYEAGVALLPSLTDISKRALVTGVPITEPPRVSIAEAAREQLARAGVRGYVGYDTRELLAALQDPQPPQCLIWFANTLDRLAHDRQDIADDAIVRGYLEGLGRDLARMCTICTERGLAFHVLIGSDHGSTLLPPGAPTRRVPQAAREVMDVWETVEEQRGTSAVSARAVMVSDGPKLQLDQPDEWHQLARLPYQLPQDYLVPRGYAAVGRRPSGWTHGGLTPEETVVPLMHLAPEPLAVQHLRLTLSGQVRSQHAGSLALLVVNPNPAPLDNVVIRVEDLPPVSIDRIAAGGRSEAAIQLPARAIEGAELPLAWELTGSVLGVAHRQQGLARIPVRRLQTEDRFDDLF